MALNPNGGGATGNIIEGNSSVPTVTGNDPSATRSGIAVVAGAPAEQQYSPARNFTPRQYSQWHSHPGFWHYWYYCVGTLSAPCNAAGNTQWATVSMGVLISSAT